MLHSLVDKSNINKQLEVYNNQGNQDQVAGDFGRHSLYKMLGYFSLVSLIRLHALLGDFYQSIKNYQNDQINKQTDQMYVLLSLYLTLHFQRIDESLQTLRDKYYSEKMNKMQRGELPEFEACFTFSCSKFLSPVPPAYDMTDLEEDALHKEPLRLQLKVFMDKMQQQLLILPETVHHHAPGQDGGLHGDAHRGVQEPSAGLQAQDEECCLNQVCKHIL